jgi:diaminopimelate epimerase
MRVLNADGSEAEMCGNGIRCVAKVLHDQDPAMRREVLRIDTGAGLLACKIGAQDGRAESVTVEMGVPQLMPRLVPVASDATRLVRSTLRAQDRDFRLHRGLDGQSPRRDLQSTTTPPSLRDLAATYGPASSAIRCSRAEPTWSSPPSAKARRMAPEIDLVVWERGCGITLACGTGACATVVAACLEGRVRPIARSQCICPAARSSSR